MLIYLINIVFIFLGIIYTKKEKNVLNPITILFLLWSVIVIFSKMQLYTLYETSSYIYYYIYFGLTSFLIGYCFFRFITKNKGLRLKNIKTNLNSKEYLIFKKNLCYLFIIFCIAFIGIKFVKNIPKLFEYGVNLASVQKVLQEDNTNTNGNILNAISFIIINPLSLTLTVIISVEYMIGKKDKKLFLLVIILNLLRVLSTGGRQAFIQIFIILMVANSFNSNFKVVKESVSKISKKKKAIIIIILSIFVLLILSLSRTSNVIKTIYLDFAMQPYMFEKWSKIIEEENLHAYGLSSISGFIYPILYLMKNLMKIFNEIPEFFNSIYNMNLFTMEKWVAIGDTLIANAYVSVFWHLYYDFRLLGIIIGMFIMGVISYNSFIKAKIETNTKSVSKYAMIVLLLFYTFGDMEFSKVYFALAYIYIPLFFMKKEE